MSKSPKIPAFTILITFICLALVGSAFIPLLPLKLSPSRNLPTLTINFTMPNNPARVIEMEATARLESMLARIKGIKEITSTSGNGWGSIRLELDKHTDIDVARFEVSAIIRQTWPGLPRGTTYPYLSTTRADDKESRPFLTFTLNAAATPVFIQRFAEEHIKPRLAVIPGIDRIDVSGATPMEWRLEYDSRQLTLLGVTVQDIQEAISNFYTREFLGIARTNSESGEWIRLALSPVGTEDTFDPRLISVTGKEGKLIRLDQLVKVTRQEEQPQSYYRINGLNSIYLNIRAEDTANQLQLAKAIMDEMDGIRPSLPAGYQVHTSYDATEYIRDELAKIYFRTALTVAILLLFVLLITRNFRYLFLIVTTLVINLCIAVIFYYLFKLELQLYSLAGVTISLSLVIDNTIVMADHIRNRQNREAFLSILTATLTTIGALAIIFFLDERIRLNLQDFAAVVIINLAVSLLTALFFVPAMMEKTGLDRKKSRSGKLAARFRRIEKKIAYWFTRYYYHQIRLMTRWKKLAYLLILLAFGLPVFMLPDKIKTEEIEPDSKWLKPAEKYNEWVRTPVYKEKIKPIVDKALGGSLRLFVEKVYEGSYFTRSEEVVLSVSASMPNGTTIDQMNHLITRMETFLSGFEEIRQFQTTIHNSRQAYIAIHFTKESEHSGFPYMLKSRIISKALELGGGSWNVWGLMDQGFSNNVSENAGSYRIVMYGYNYDELYEWAEKLREELLSARRIQAVTINSEFAWWKDDYREFFFDLNKARIAEEKIHPYELYSSIYPVLGTDIHAGTILYENEIENLKLLSRQSYTYDLWNILHTTQWVQGRPYKLAELAAVNKEQMPQNVVKINQQYRLCLQYEYIGAGNQGTRIQERILRDFNRLLPMGYTAQKEGYDWFWGKKDKKQYFLLALIVVIIFFTTSILFNSLKQPLAVIFVIPISYIGVFLTFYWFKLNFDQGGFASFVLLCGITVNASIYILNEYNRIRQKHPNIPNPKAYLKAWNAKIVPIFLTVVSTILGFIPFMIGSQKEGFWFPLAAGTIGGLIMSVIGIFFYLPLFTLKKKDFKK